MANLLGHVESAPRTFCAGGQAPGGTGAGVMIRDPDTTAPGGVRGAIKIVLCAQPEAC